MKRTLSVPVLFIPNADVLPELQFTMSHAITFFMLPALIFFFTTVLILRTGVPFSPFLRYIPFQRE